MRKQRRIRKRLPKVRICPARAGKHSGVALYIGREWLVFALDADALTDEKVIGALLEHVAATLTGPSSYGSLDGTPLSPLYPATLETLRREYAGEAPGVAAEARTA